MKQKGFTLIEILIVIFIIGILAAIVLVSVNSAREEAKVGNAVDQIRELLTATAFYYDDTNRYPPNCRLDCTASTDPFLNSLGVSGWHGPYFKGLWNFNHPWGGQFTLYQYDADGDGKLDVAVVLDDDMAGTDAGNDQGAIPISAMTQIDKIIDDGNLSTGNVRGNGGFSTASGEMVVLFKL